MTNQLTADQIGTAGLILEPQSRGYGMAVHDGRYGWDGGYGTVWFNDPLRELVGIALAQTTEFLFAGGRDEFIALARQAAG